MATALTTIIEDIREVKKMMPTINKVLVLAARCGTCGELVEQCKLTITEMDVHADRFVFSASRGEFKPAFSVVPVIGKDGKAMVVCLSCFNGMNQDINRPCIDCVETPIGEQLDGGGEVEL